MNLGVGLRDRSYQSCCYPVTFQTGTQGEAELQFYPFASPALEGGGWSAPRPGRFTPWKDTQYPLYGRLGGPRRRTRRAGIQSPGPPSPGQSLHRLSYPGTFLSEQVEANFNVDKFFFYNGSITASGPRPPHYLGFVITLRHITLGRTLLDE